MCDRNQKLQINSISSWLLIAACSLTFTTQNALMADEAPAAKERSLSVSALGFPDRITTLDGKTYHKTTLERVDPDGLLVVFAPAEGGSGSAKLKFRNLSAELRERFGYSAAQASDYEAALAQGEAIWRAENAVWTEQRRTAQAEEAAWERQMRAEAEARLAAEAQQARIDAVRSVETPAYYYDSGWLWPGGNYCASPRFGKGFPNKHILQKPAACFTGSPVSSFMGPMRPLGR